MRFIKLLTVTAVALTLSACVRPDVKPDIPPSVQPTEQVMVIHPAPPPGLNMRDVKWRVLNREQLEYLLKTTQGDFVMYAMTVKNYENLSLNLQEVIRYIEEQKEMIIYYRKLFPNDVLTETEPTK
jgi:hypothetical protein